MRGAARRCGRATRTSASDMSASLPAPRSSRFAAWVMLHVLLAFTYVTVTRPVCAFPATDLFKQSSVRLTLPPFHIALSGDLHVQIITPPLSGDLFLKLLRQDGAGLQPLTSIAIIPDARTLTTNLTVLRLPCGFFSRGGLYIIRVMRRELNATNVESYVPLVSRQLDVRWPSPKLMLVPNHVQTYPNQPVIATLEFPEVVCPPIGNEFVPSAIPEFWLELHFCGPSTVSCDSKNSSAQVLYSEQMRGFPGRHDITLRCELFGLAGHYALVLRPTSDLTSPVTTTAVYLKADWSEQFVFNVMARSILPCDPFSKGIGVLFEYPACILASGDRVRLYARLRADVSTLAPPTTLEYVAEKRFTRGVHTIHFDCDLFKERYVEYCFTYVSQAITGAVADVRMDCVPTLPVSESDTGGWGEWSSWTPCTTSCAGGTRNRHRFCDSPPPRYGAKFCEGPAVETEKCGGLKMMSGDDAQLAAETNNNSDASGNDEKDMSAVDWECIYGGGDSVNSDEPADRPEVRAEVGFGCRCGCVVHLGKSKPRRLVATSAQSCPGRTFWLIKADSNYVVRFKVDHFRLPCNLQWLKIRDGNFPSDTLIQELVGAPGADPPPAIVSSGPHLLLEFFSDELLTAEGLCNGGFLAHAQQIPPRNENSTIIRLAVAQDAVIMSPTARFTVVHVVALMFVTVVLLVSVALVTQYVLRYRKYQLAEDMDSLADLSADGSTMNLAIPVRAGSSSTLLSEVISLTRLRPKIKSKHSRLRESLDCETTLAAENNEDSETPVEEETSLGSTTTLQQEMDTTVTTATTALVTNTESVISPSDTMTAESLPSSPKSSPMRKSTTFSPTDQKSKENLRNDNISLIIEQPSNDKEKARIIFRRYSNASNATLTNGCYSPAPSTVSCTATIRTTTNQKENKEKKNRERLLAGQGSEFSLNGPDTDLELDYYDYNVVNAGAAPGSYLGMDPAFLVWIPPLDDTGEILNVLEENPEQIYKEIQAQQHVDPGSNTESPENEVILTGKLRIQSIGDVSDETRDTLKRVHQSKMIIPSSVKISDIDICTKSNGQPEGSVLNKQVSPDKNKNNFIPMQEFTKAREIKKNDSFAKVHSMKEKETNIEKSPSKDYCKTDVRHKENNDEIKFADDDDDEIEEDDEDKCNIEKNDLKTACADINIIASQSS